MTWRYQNGEEVRAGDRMQGGWCGTCTVVDVTSYHDAVTARSTQSGVVLMVDPADCDLLGRFPETRAAFVGRAGLDTSDGRV